MTWRRLRRRLGVPRLSRRGRLWVAVVLLALLAGAALVGEFLVSTGRYRPQYYEPKDFSREEQVEREMKTRPPAQP